MKTGALRRIRRALAVILVTGGLIVGSFFVVTRIFRVTSIEIIGVGIEGIRVDEKRFAANLLFIPSKKLVQELLNDYPQIIDVKVRKKYPHTLVLILSQREPIARLEISGKTVLVSTDGVVLGSALSGELPLIRIPAASIPQRGGKIEDARILSALKFLTGIGQDKKTSLVDIFDETSLRAKIDKTDILFPHNSDLDDRVATLQTLLMGFRIQARMPARIDLRFQKPVVTF